MNASTGLEVVSMASPIGREWPEAGRRGAAHDTTIRIDPHPGPLPEGEGGKRAPASASILAVALAAILALGVALAPSGALAQASSDQVVTANQTATEPLADEGPIPQRSLLAIVRSGGVLMVPILFCSVLVTVFVFERTVSLRRGRVIPGPFVKRILHQIGDGQLDRDEALALCEENPSAVAKVFAGAVRKWGRPGVEVEQAILDGGERAVNQLRRYLRVFNGVATVTPLLGMLGTVVGMIRAFNEIATSNAMGRPELLASGISEALLTTAAGLTVAIPALIFYLFFISRVDRLIVEIDSLGQELVELISADAKPAAVRSKTPRGRSREAA